MIRSKICLSIQYCKLCFINVESNVWEGEPHDDGWGWTRALSASRTTKTVNSAIINQLLRRSDQINRLGGDGEPHDEGLRLKQKATYTGIYIHICMSIYVCHIYRNIHVSIYLSMQMYMCVNNLIQNTSRWAPRRLPEAERKPWTQKQQTWKLNHAALMHCKKLTLKSIFFTNLIKSRLEWEGESNDKQWQTIRSHVKSCFVFVR